MVSVGEWGGLCEIHFCVRHSFNWLNSLAGKIDYAENKSVMAKLEQGILGPFRGTVGTVIGYRWRDRWCMRARPSHYNDRRSEAQLEQRGRFKAMIQFASPATPLLRIGLRAWAAEHGLTEGNAFLRLNHGCFSGISGDSGSSGNSGGSGVSGGIDFAGLRFSWGHLPGIVGGAAERVDAERVRVRWERGLGRGADWVHVYAYCPAAGRGMAVARVERSRKGAEFVLPADFAGEEVHLWAFVENAEGVVSPTLYLAFSDGATGAGREEGACPMAGSDGKDGRLFGGAESKEVSVALVGHPAVLIEEG